MKSILTSAALALGILAVPAVTFAATYEYVDNNGVIQTEVSDTPTDALNQAINIAPHSGVMLVTGVVTTTTTNPITTTSTTNPVTTTSTSNSGNTITVTTTPITASTTANNLRVTLNNLLSEHITSSLDVLRAISDGNTNEMNGALQEQDANAVDLAAAIGSVYGSSAQATFLQEFRAHITASNAYTMGLKNGSLTDQQTALANLDTQLQAITNTLSSANPNINNATLLAALRQHESLVNQASQDYEQGNVTGSYTVERQAITQIQGGADYLANAIITQYPTKFAN